MSDDIPPLPSVPLSLKARENASRSLKRIFDQINESVSDKQPSVLNFLPCVDGSDNVNKLPEKHYPKQQSQEFSAGLRQQGGTRDFLSLQSYGAESNVEEEAPFEGNVKASPQRLAGTKFSPMPFSKEEPKETRRFGSIGRASLSVDNGRFNSQDPPPGRLSSNQQDHEAPADQLKDLGGLAFPRAASTQEGNRRALGCTASPTSSFMAHQQGDFTSYSEIGGNGLLGMAQATSRPSSSSAARKQRTGQMTIFYSGIVNVYDDVPAEKAHAIMLLAGSGNPRASYLLGGTPSTAAPSSGAVATPVGVSAAKNVVPMTSGVPFTSSVEPSSSTALPTSFPSPVKQVVQRSHAELPFARKVSLARFLERRRDRVQSKTMQNNVDGVPEPEAKRVCSRSTSPSPAGISR